MRSMRAMRYAASILLIAGISASLRSGHGGVSDAPGGVRGRALSESQNHGASPAYAYSEAAGLTITYSVEDSPSGSGSSGSGGPPDSKCDYVHSLSLRQEQCAFVSKPDSPCADVANLVDYLYLYYCSESPWRDLALLLIIVVLSTMISLLATTADFFFVPPLEYLSSYLKLSPDVGGITLLALGNGAPDVFTAFAAVNTASDFELTLGGLLGASIFISSVVLGSVLLVSKPRLLEVEKEAFLRDVVVYIFATGTIFFVARDGLISIYEAASFLVIYVAYVAFVVVRSRMLVSNRSQRLQTDPLLHGHSHTQLGNYSGNDSDAVDTRGERLPAALGDYGASGNSDTSLGDAKTAHRKSSVVSLSAMGDEGGNFPLIGLSWRLTKVGGPGGGIRTFIARCQFILEYPFSILRHLSTPTCDGQWDTKRRYLSCISPMGLGCIVLLDAQGWAGFTQPLYDGSSIPLVAAVLGAGALVGLLIFVATLNTVDSDDLPGITPLLQLGAFASSVVWMDVLANEAVALMESLGISFSISTGVLGLTVIAVGNSVGDFVADTAVARAGEPKMSIATCFGSPLFNDVVGLGLSLTAACARIYPNQFEAELSPKLYVAWGFLAVALLSSLILFPAKGFRPPRWFAAPLYLLYFAFLTVQILALTKVIDF